MATCPFRRGCEKRGNGDISDCDFCETAAETRAYEQEHSTDDYIEYRGEPWHTPSS